MIPRRLVHALALWVLLLACSVPVQVQRHSTLSGRPLDKIALVRLQADPGFESRVGREAAARACDLVTARVLEQLGRREYQAVIPPEEVEAVVGAGLGRDPREIGPRLEQTFGVAAWLTGTVERFRPRTGSGEGVSLPAAVRFKLRLHGRDGALLWRGTYDEEQKSLSADIRSLTRAQSRSFRWVSAERLAGYGAEQLVQRLPERP